jgi:hypothetical protein
MHRDEASTADREENVIAMQAGGDSLDADSVKGMTRSDFSAQLAFEMNSPCVIVGVAPAKISPPRRKHKVILGHVGMMPAGGGGTGRNKLSGPLTPVLTDGVDRPGQQATNGASTEPSATGSKHARGASGTHF